MSTIALDAMGGDTAPNAPVAAAAALSLERDGPQILLVGKDGVVGALLDQVRHDAEKIAVVHAPDVIPMDANPKEALKAMPEASLLVAAKLVADGDADALVSAGNTGAVTLACAKHFKRLPGIRRCALGAVYPTERRRGHKDDPFSLILDAGLTPDATADDLVGFAIMGAFYAEVISHNPTPRVALLSNGHEAGKGTKVVVEAHKRLLRMHALNFVGNIEGMDIPKGVADVVIVDGFTGNVVLKMLEGVATTARELARYAYRQKLLYRAGLALLAPALRQLKALTDWRQYGGAPILGFSHLCIKAHGRSGPRALSNAMKVAHKSVNANLIGKIRDGVSDLKRESSGDAA
jgi:glycerol-3-phosphate acyltransferase PlsX